MTTDAWNLERFARAQDAAIDAIRKELLAGRKSSHWMWFVFPQVSGLGFSPASVAYGISGLDEARAYLAHPVLGPRLKDCCRLVLEATGSAELIFGPIDAMKLRSSMTLFHRADPTEPSFGEVLDRFFGGAEDEATLARL